MQRSFGLDIPQTLELHVVHDQSQSCRITNVKSGS